MFSRPATGFFFTQSARQSDFLDEIALEKKKTMSGGTNFSAELAITFE